MDSAIHLFNNWDLVKRTGLGLLAFVLRQIKGDVTRDDSHRRLLAQHSVAMLEQYFNYSKPCRNNGCNAVLR